MCLHKISGIGHKRIFFLCCGLTCESLNGLLERLLAPWALVHLVSSWSRQVICHFALIWRGSGTLSTEVLTELNDLNPTLCIAQIIKDFDFLDRIEYDTSESQWKILEGKVYNISETKYVARKNLQFRSAPLLFWAHDTKWQKDDGKMIENVKKMSERWQKDVRRKSNSLTDDGSWNRNKNFDNLKWTKRN